MKNPNKLTDTSPMPYGKYKGKAMQDVPVEYLHFLKHKTLLVSWEGGRVLNYINENLSALQMENKDLLWD